MEVLTLYQILCLIGVPSLATIIGWIFWLYKKLNAVKLGIQALLRGQMISDYNRWMDKGYAPIYARENFQNCWEQYHSLGVNGVMDDIHEKFMDLPTKNPNRNKNENDEE